MAPMGRQLRSKEDGGTMEKYVTGREDTWKNGVESIREIGELRKEMRETRSELEKVKEQLAEEIKIGREERREEREEWKKEKEIIERRLTDLEWINERMERQNRKKNIIIKGLTEKEEMAEQDIEKYIGETLKIKVRIKKASEIKTKEKDKWMSWEQKREVMEEKRNLKKGVRIEDDLTRKEREIQDKLWDMAREEREKDDDEVRVGYKKIFLKRKWYWWNEKEDELREERFGREI